MNQTPLLRMTFTWDLIFRDYNFCSCELFNFISAVWQIFDCGILCSVFKLWLNKIDTIKVKHISPWIWPLLLTWCKTTTNQSINQSINQSAWEASALLIQPLLSSQMLFLLACPGVDGGGAWPVVGRVDGWCQHWLWTHVVGCWRPTIPAIHQVGIRVEDIMKTKYQF